MIFSLSCIKNAVFWGKSGFGGEGRERAPVRAWKKQKSGWECESFRCERRAEWLWWEKIGLSFENGQIVQCDKILFGRWGMGVQALFFARL